VKKKNDNLSFFEHVIVVEDTCHLAGSKDRK
jgi:hypothetical protein